MATAEEPLDEPSVSGIMDQWCRTRVDVDPQVGTHGDGRSPADLEPHGRVARLKFADDRPADADHPSDLRLRHTQPQPKLTQLWPVRMASMRDRRAASRWTIRREPASGS